MYNMQQLAEAQHAVYIISNPDGSDASLSAWGTTATAESVWQHLAHGGPGGISKA